jgi:uncharacterized protein YyaL (SSP411 family)
VTTAVYHRNLTVVGKNPGEDGPSLPLFEGRDQVDETPTAYLCRSYACQAPVTRPEALQAQLEEAPSG